MRKTIKIDCFPESISAYGTDYAIVAIDVIRATTTAVTAVALGWDCYPTPSLEAAVPLAARLHSPLLVGELGGSMPYGFDLNNSPAQLQDRTDTQRPLILLSTSGTRLMCGAKEGQPLYVASLRNFHAQVDYLAAHHSTVVAIGAGSRGEFREEDQLCCAWIAEGLIDRGYEPEDETTAAIVERWHGMPVDSICDGASAAYLLNTGQSDDLDFILTHVDDLDEVYRMEQDRVVKATADYPARYAIR